METQWLDRSHGVLSTGVSNEKRSEGNAQWDFKIQPERKWDSKKTWEISEVCKQVDKLSGKMNVLVAI